MAKQALLGVLESTIGKYVKNLDANQLNVGIWSGQVQLHDLELDVASCNAELDRQAAEFGRSATHIKVVGGSFESLQVKIPWAHLSNQSVVIKAQGLHVHVAPHNRYHETDFLRLVVDKEEERIERQEQRRQDALKQANETRLHTKELKKLADLGDVNSSNENNNSNKRGFVARLVKRIVENLQVEINDVQVTIQKEDSIKAGVQMENFSFCTTDMSGRQIFVDRTSTEHTPSDLLNKFLYKKLKISGFGVFVDTSNQDAHSYVVDPVQFTAQYREADPSICDEYPKWLLKSEIPAVKLGLSHLQYQKCTEMLTAVSPSQNEARPLFPEYRPLHRISKATVREWWHYAYKCLGRLSGRRSWLIFYQAFRTRRLYVELYKRKYYSSECAWLPSLSIEEEADLHRIEIDRTITLEGIMAWRNLADAQVEKERSKHDKKQPKPPKKSVLSNLFGGGEDDNTESSREATPITLSADELKELEGVGMAEWDYREDLTNESKLCRIEFSLGEFSVLITNEKNQAMLGLEMGTVAATLDADVGGSFTHAFTLQSLEVLDHLHSSSLFPKVVRSLQNTDQQEEVFQAYISKDRKGDSKLSVKLLPSEVVIAPHLLAQIMEFLTLPATGATSSSTNEGIDVKNELLVARQPASETDYSEYTDGIANAMVAAWQQKTKEVTYLKIDLDLQAPIIVVPENCDDPTASVVVLDLGGFKFQYGLPEATQMIAKWLDKNPRDPKLRSDDSKSTDYGIVVDYGRLELEHMTFLVGEAESWGSMGESQNLRLASAKNEAIIEPITIQFDFAIESAVGSSIPRACVFADIPKSNFKFSPLHLYQTLRVYTSWMDTIDQVQKLRSLPSGSGISSKESIVGKQPAAGSHTMPCEQSPSLADGEEQVGERLKVKVYSEQKNSRSKDFKASEPDAVQSRSSVGHKIASSGAIHGGGEGPLQVDVQDVNQAVDAAYAKQASLFVTLHVHITAAAYSFVVYDSGNFQARDGFDVRNSQSGSIMPLLHVAEGLVLQGGMALIINTSTDKSGENSSSDIELQARKFEIFTGYGRELRRPLQILEPFSGNVNIGLDIQGVKTKKTQVKSRVDDMIDLNLSTRNLALVNAISSQISACFEQSFRRVSDSDIESVRAMADTKAQRIKAISSALEGDESLELAADSRTLDGMSADDQGVKMERASASIFLLDMKAPKTKFTIINDLQGYDEAIFRVEMKDFAAKSMIAMMQDLVDASLCQTTFHVKLQSQIVADYFDPSVNTWKDLLQNPWSITFRAERAPEKASKTGRFSTRTDVHFMPIHLAFSEHFLIGLSSAKNMFSRNSAMQEEQQISDDGCIGGRLKGASEPTSNEKPTQSRHSATALPFCLENFCGLDVEFFVWGSKSGNRNCPAGSKNYFQFTPPQGNGHGGLRRYGQDLNHKLLVKIFVGQHCIEIENIDEELGRPKRCHNLDDETLILTSVVKEGKSTLIRLSSNLYFQNRTSIPVSVAVVLGSEKVNVGVCKPTSCLIEKSATDDVQHGTLSKTSRRLGMNIHNLAKLNKQLAETRQCSLRLKVMPDTRRMGKGYNDEVISGEHAFQADLNTICNARHATMQEYGQIVCASCKEGCESLLLHASVKYKVIDNEKLIVSIYLLPCAQLVNTLPISITVLTRTSRVVTDATNAKADRKKLHDLDPGAKMEIFSAGEALEVKIRCSGAPVQGATIGMTRQWQRLPLTYPMIVPMLSLFPFDRDSDRPATGTPGSEFFIAEASSALPDFFLERINPKNEAKTHGDSTPIEISKSASKTFLITVGTYGIDHTRSILFQQMVIKRRGFWMASKETECLPFSSFKETGGDKRVSLLPTSEIPLRLIEAKKSTNRKKTAIFRVEEVSMSEGGAQATPLLWDDGADSGYYVYRKLVSSFQSELHVIPEFLVFNGSDRYCVKIKQPGVEDVKVEAGGTAPIFAADRRKGLPLSFTYASFGGSTKMLQLEELGLHVELIRNSKGVSLGSIAIQTSIGEVDSRLLIKLGEVGEIEKKKATNLMDYWPSSFQTDSFRFRFQAEQLVISLNQAIQRDGESMMHRTAHESDGEVALQKLCQSARQASTSPLCEGGEKPILAFAMQNVVYDFQRLFKETKVTGIVNKDERNERCQMSFIVHGLKILDLTPNSPFPTVFCCAGKNHFVDFCVRTKGPLYSDSVKVDLYDVILAHSGEDAEKNENKMFLQTSEDFLWTLIDLADLISHASDVDAQPDDVTELDKALQAYVPKFSLAEVVNHTKPQVETIYSIAKARVSPFNLVVSFRRSPQADRYEKLINSQGASLMRYFTQQLKFTIDKCDLHFARYELQNLKGPHDRLTEKLKAVYIGRMKLKTVQLLAATNFGDWKSLASREDGDDEFVDGDILRVSGALAGNSVAYAFNKVGYGMGKSVTLGLESLGGSIENGASLVGARKAGVGINSVIAGVGGGIGGTVKGVGEGTGNVFKGVGQGLGHFFGGLSGGGSKIVKGVGRGVTTGDASAVASGVKEGVKHMGSGIRTSVTSVGNGVSDGAKSIVRGSVTGVKDSLDKVKKKSSTRATIDDLAKLREEFKDQSFD